MTSQSTQSSFIKLTLKELTKSDLPLLCNALNSVAPECFALGLQLGVEEEKIKIIMANNTNNCQAQLREIISDRLKQVPCLTWHDVFTALRSPSVNHPDLVRHIESWYISPSVDLQQQPSSDPPSDPQQHLSLGGERPYHMVMMSQRTVNRRENPNMDMTSVPTSSLWGAPFSNQMGGPYWENYQPPTQMMGPTPVRGPPHGENYQPPTQMMGQIPVRGLPHGENYQPPTQMMGQIPVRGPPHGENYQPRTQMMGQIPVRGPPHGENYQPPTQMMGQIPVRGLPHGENYQPPTQMMGQIPVRGPPHGENYQPHTQMMGPTPVRGAPHRENYQPFALMRGPVDIRPPDKASLRNPYMYLPHHMTPYQTVHPNTLPTTQPYPTTHTQGSSATAYHRSPMDIFVHYICQKYIRAM